MDHDRPAERREPAQGPAQRPDQPGLEVPAHIGWIDDRGQRETWRRLLAAWTQPLAVIAD